MKKQQTTYTTSDMLKLINSAGMNLLMRKKKMSLESKIQRQKEERDYLAEILSGLKKRLSDLDPELKEAQSQLQESLSRYESLKADRDALQQEIVRLQEIERKAAVIEQKKRELAFLKDAVFRLQSEHEKAQTENAELRRIEATLSERLGSAEKALKEKRDNLSSLRQRQEGLIAQIAGFDILGYIEGLRLEAERVSAVVRDRSYKSGLREEMSFFVACMQLARKIEDLHRTIDGASIEERRMLRGFKEINDSGSLSSLRQGIMSDINELAGSYRKEIHSLSEQRSSLERGLSLLNEQVNTLRNELSLRLDELKRETDFRDKAKSRIKELSDELEAKRAELKAVKSEAERINLDIEINKAFANALEPINEQLASGNRKLGDLLDGYRGAFEKALMSIRSKGN